MADTGKEKKEVNFAKKPVESVYNASEFTSAARVKFNTSPDIVAAAFKVAGKTEATLTEAQKIVQEFLKREVK